MLSDDYKAALRLCAAQLSDALSSGLSQADLMKLAERWKLISDHGFSAARKSKIGQAS